MGKKFIFDLESTGLDFPENRIISIAIKDIDTGENQIFLDIDEAAMLTAFWNAVAGADELIGFNNMDFDLPALMQRSIVRSVKVKLPKKVIDLRKEATGFWYSYNKFSKGTLRVWAELLGLKPSTESGALMAQFWVKGEFEVIKQHNIEDVELTYSLYKRMKECDII